MTSTESYAQRMIASAEEDPNATIICSSPPCFMHELDPAYLGYLGREEVAALLEDLLAAEWSGTWLETAWIRAMLRRHLAHLGSERKPFRSEIRVGAESGALPPGAGQAQLACRLREALPRLQDDALRKDLRDLFWTLERDQRRYNHYDAA